MKRINNIICSIAGLALTAVLLPTLSSCESYLDTDKYFYDMSSLDSTFVRKNTMYAYLNSASSYLPQDDRMWTNADNPFAFSSDEAFCSWNDDRHAGIKYALGEINQFSDYFNNWANFYKGIRKANMLLQRMGECQDISEIERIDVAGQAYFLRAYLYYSLLRQYGPIPLLPDNVIESNASVDEMSFPRATYDECVDYICRNFDEAAKRLDSERNATETYRVPTRGAAMALKSRVLLEAASPWFNGNTYYSDFKRSTDGQLYFNQTRDPQKWGKAAAAAKRVIDLGMYSLYTVSASRDTPQLPDEVSKEPFPNGVGGIDPLRSYSDMFTAEEAAINIPEIIWARNENNDNAWITFPAIMGGGNGLNVSQQLVDAYRMANGRDINDPSSGYPTEDEAWKPIGTAKSFSGYQLRANTAQMYNNREPRFYATIAFNHHFREGSSYTGTAANHKNLEVTYYINGTGAAWSDYPNDKCFSGYSSMKYVHPSDCPGGAYRAKMFPIIRYAEVLLNYVEAMNEMEGAYTDEENSISVSRNTAEMVKYFNMVRYRAGLPGITEADAADQAAMRELIKRERQVELALEGRRFFDLRRWGDLVRTMQTPFYGMNTNAKTAEREAFHKRTQVSYRYAIYAITAKAALYPIKQDIVDRNRKLDQAPGW